MYAAQLMDSFRKTEGANLSTEEGIRNLLNWLRVNLHSKARLHSADKLIETITGSTLQVEPYLKYLAQSVL